MEFSGILKLLLHQMIFQKNYLVLLMMLFKPLVLKNRKLNLVFKTKKELDILNINSINRSIKNEKPKIILHTAGLSRPMNIHDSDISKSINLNIIGTCNIVKACKKNNIKLIYFLLVTFMREKKETIKSLTLLNHLITMDCLN